jgi:putative hydrolase of the HAD superfamily
MSNMVECYNLEHMIKAILFDLDGTLFDRCTSVVRCIEQQYDRFQDLLAHVPKEHYVARFVALDCRGYVTKDIVYQQFVTDFALSQNMWEQLFQDFYTSYHHHAVGFPQLQAVLSTLRSQGFRLGMITNGRAVHQQATIQALAIEPFFDAILISEAEGLRKPDVRIFNRALNRLGVLPQESVFIGDHPHVDIAGARNAGMWSIWKRDVYWAESCEADTSIDDLLAIPTAVQSLCCND